MEGYRRKPRRDTVHREKVCGVQDKSTRRGIDKGKASARKQGERGGTLRDLLKRREEIGMKTYLRGPIDYAKTLKLQFRVGDLDLPERRKRYASSREGEEIAQMCPCGKAVE